MTTTVTGDVSMDRRTDRLERVLGVLVQAKEGDQEDGYDSALAEGLELEQDPGSPYEFALVPKRRSPQ